MLDGEDKRPVHTDLDGFGRVAGECHVHHGSGRSRGFGALLIEIEKGLVKDRSGASS